jgi:hypothetical protein
MTSLDLAFEDDIEQQMPPPPPKKKQQSNENLEYQMSIPQQPPSPPPPMPPQMPKKEHFSNYYPYPEQTPAPQQIMPQQIYQYSFWDRMVMSRREVMKLFILSIVIILGISLEKIGSHYVNQYLSSNDLTNVQELLVRLSFPIIIFIILWIIKSL